MNRGVDREILNILEAESVGCCEDKRKNDKDPELVECETCKMKTGKSVAAVMYLKGSEHFFCSHECQDRWEVLHPDKLW